LKTGDEIQLGPVVIKVETIYQVAEEPANVPVASPNAPVASPNALVASPNAPAASSGSPNYMPQAVATDHPSIPLADVGAEDPSVLLASPHSTTQPIRKHRYANKTIFEEDFPSGNCVNCNRHLTSKEMSTHGGIFRENYIYCLPCFCEGAGNFPTIAGYRIVKKLGGGGMGDVYEAIQLSMERPVAFKLMRGLENASEPQVRRFFREARTGGKLNHPNIVGFIDAGKLEGACYIAMEFIYGVDVKQIIQELGPIHYAEAARIAYYVALALDYAATKFNIVHRDVKPENILIDRDYSIKLTDFGLAKNFEEAGLSGITKSQTGVGTLFYMSPEQILEARFADQRADIYSLGVSLYEMVTGVKPFYAEQMMALVQKIRTEQPRPIAEIVPSVPSSMIAVISKAMEKNLDKRYQTIKEFIAALRPFLQKLTTEV